MNFFSLLPPHTGPVRRKRSRSAGKRLLRGETGEGLIACPGWGERRNERGCKKLKSRLFRPSPGQIRRWFRFPSAFRFSPSQAARPKNSAGLVKLDNARCGGRLI